MSFAPISILVHEESPILKYDFLFSVKVPDIHMKQRSVSESMALYFDYQKPHLITAAIIWQERSVFVVLDEAIRKCSSA